jgi:TPR repeat protein
MKRLLLLIVLLSQSVFADLEQAIAYAEVGDVRKGQIELYNISQRALEGQPKSMCEFGTMYKKEGYWIVQSDKDASDWWLKSAEMGYAPCQFNIGTAYLIGSGIEKDLSKAKYWLQKAIDSTYEKYSKSAKVIYAIHELDNY